jgi:hypothetical protein
MRASWANQKPLKRFGMDIENLNPKLKLGENERNTKH